MTGIRINILLMWRLIWLLRSTLNLGKGSLKISKELAYWGEEALVLFGSEFIDPQKEKLLLSKFWQKIHIKLI